MLTVAYDNLIAMLLVFVRMGGMLFTNPIFGRRQVPTQLRIALVLILSIIIYPNIDSSAVVGIMDFAFIVVLFKELLIGLFFSMIFTWFYYLLFYAGDFLDVQFGLAMAKSFDPTTNIQASVSGRIFELYFVLYIFATNSHLTLIKIFATSFDMIPLGADYNINATSYLFSLITSVFVLVLQLTLPFFVTLMVVEVALAVLMRLVPQMHIMVVNIQVKILLGLFLLIALSAPISIFIDEYIMELFTALNAGLVHLSSN